MDITGRTAWTVAKDGQAIQLTIEDLQHLFSRLAWSGDLLVTDETSWRTGSGSEEIGISLNDDAIEIALLKGERQSCG
jgi:hypothetical protein